MRNVWTKPTTWATTAALVVALHTAVGARVDVKVGFDKTFDFTAVRTWGWSPQGPGEVKMARTQDDDPAAMHERTKPIVVEAVTAAFQQRGLTPATGEPDLTVTYYLLLTTSMSAQTLGQFLP